MRTTVRYGTPAGRWVLLATVLGSGMAMLDSTVVNIALPTIGRDFHSGLASLQWVVNAYALTLAGFLLLGGSLGDHYGRRRVFVVGAVWFALGSLLCGLAPSAGALIAARAFQGMGAALLTPGSLAIIQSSFEPEGRAAAVGAWSGLGGVAVAIGPLLGGWLVGAASWRYIFFINLPFAALVVWAAARHVPETRDPRARGVPLDLPGAALAALGLAGLTYALTEGRSGGFGARPVLVSGAVGVAALVGFVLRERLASHPMVPLELFSSLQFSSANTVTLLVYAALAGTLFLLPIQLQQVVRYTPLQSGTALLPTTLVMLALSARIGRLSGRIGPRPLMAAGPMVAGVGFALLVRVGAGSGYAVDVLPAVLVFGLGMALTVAPLTSTVLAAGGDQRAGVSSAVNNDVARIAGLLAVAVIPAAVGLTGADYRRPAAFAAGFHSAVLVSAALCVAGGLLALATIRRPPPVAPPEGEASYCPLVAPPLLGEEAVA